MHPVYLIMPFENTERMFLKLKWTNLLFWENMQHRQCTTMYILKFADSVQEKYKNVINSTCPCNVAVTTFLINEPETKKYDFLIKNNDGIATEYLFSNHNTSLEVFLKFPSSLSPIYSPSNSYPFHPLSTALLIPSLFIFSLLSRSVERWPSLS